jgi:predicted nucleic acid-binding Zn ribbon protein
MSDEPVKECEMCGEPVRRLLFPVAIQFKGNGFYTTDYARRSSLGSAGPHAASGGDSESSSNHSSASDNGGSSGNGKSASSESGTSVPAAAKSD